MFMNAAKVSQLSVAVFLLVILGSHAAYANGSHDDASPHTGAMAFPEWTYYAEIVEHTALIILPIAAIALFAAAHRKNKMHGKPITWMAAGLAILIAGQIIVNMQHFLIFPFGIFTAIVHHGLVAAGVIVMIAAFYMLLKEKQVASIDKQM